MAVPVVEQLWLQVGQRRVALHVLELGLACCGIEVRAARRLAAVSGTLAEVSAGLPDPIAEVPGSPAARVAPPADPSGDLHVLVVAGTVTTQLAAMVVQAHAELPEPRAVLAFGACAATGGPYWDSYAVLPGAHEVVPVDVWVAGCPPRPADLAVGLEEVLRARA